MGEASFFCGVSCGDVFCRYRFCDDARSVLRADEVLLRDCLGSAFWEKGCAIRGFETQRIFKCRYSYGFLGVLWDVLGV